MDVMDGWGLISNASSERKSCTENFALNACNCGLFELLNSGGVSGDVVIENNAPGCNSKEEILAAGACTPTDVEGDASLPTAFKLGQNYPNPFNPTTAIPFAVPQPGRVNLKVYDVLGREMAVLASGDYAPGRYEAVWNATDVASGLYVYRLEANGVTITKKLVVQK